MKAILQSLALIVTLTTLPPTTQADEYFELPMMHEGTFVAISNSNGTNVVKTMKIHNLKENEPKFSINLIVSAGPATQSVGLVSGSLFGFDSGVYKFWFSSAEERCEIHVTPMKNGMKVEEAGVPGACAKFRSLGFDFSGEYKFISTH